MGSNQTNLNNLLNLDSNNMNLGNNPITMNMNMNMGLNNMSVNVGKSFVNSDKTSSSNLQNFDFFQNATPKEMNQGLKIKKINFNNDDLI